MTIQNDQISYVKHVSDPIHVLFTLFGCVDVLIFLYILTIHNDQTSYVKPYSCVFHPKGLGHNLLMQFSTLGSSKMEIFKTVFFYVLAIHHDEISYEKHVLDPLYIFCTLFGCWRGDGGLMNDFVIC